MNETVKVLDYKYFKIIRDLLYSRFGIDLKDSKLSLVQSRLNKLLRLKGFSEYKQYIDYLKIDKTGQSLVELSTHLTTNHTHFNREPAHFEYFSKTALPEHLKRQEDLKKLDLRVWCAGCSSGEESYMLAMLIRETLGNDYPRWEASLLATDLSEKVLNISQTGVYTDERLKDLPVQLRRKYFNTEVAGGRQASADLKKNIVYRRFNFMNEFPFKKPFNIIFCRNVMIYFDEETKVKLVRKFFNSLVLGGYLFVGHSESFRKVPELTYVAPGVYKKERH